MHNRLAAITLAALALTSCASADRSVRAAWSECGGDGGEAHSYGILIAAEPGERSEAGRAMLECIADELRMPTGLLADITSARSGDGELSSTFDAVDVAWHVETRGLIVTFTDTPTWSQ